MSRLGLSLISECENEQTVLEFQNKLSDFRQKQWENVWWKYSQTYNDETLVDFVNLEKLEINSDGSKFNDSSDDTDSDRSDCEEQVKDDESVFKMSQRWVNICNSMDTTNVCRFCSTLLINSTKSTVSNNTFNKRNLKENQISAVKTVKANENENDESNSELNANEIIVLKKLIENNPNLNLNSSNSKNPIFNVSKLTDNENNLIKQYGLNANEIITLKKLIKKSTNSSKTTSINQISSKTEHDLMKQYINESNCGLTVNELTILKEVIEKNVGNSLKEIGLRLNSVECRKDKKKFDKVKDELVKLLGFLVVDVSINDVCIYGEYERWKFDKFEK